MSVPAIKKLLLLGSVMLMAIIATLIVLNHNVRLRKLVHISADFNKTDIGKNNLDDKYFQENDSASTSFDRLRNDSIPLPYEIIETITCGLKEFNWSNEFNEVKLYNLYHEIIFTDQFPFDHSTLKKWVVVTFTNYNGNLCHAAAGRLSLFEFRKQHQTWVLTQKYLAFGYGTEYGLEPRWCKLVPLGNNNKFGLIVQTDYSGNGGHDKQTQSVYSWIDTSFMLVFDFTNYEYYFDYPKDFEYTEGYQKMRILKSNKDWFDIETKSEDTDWDDKTPGAVKRFVFNGEEYAEANNKLE